MTSVKLDSITLRKCVVIIFEVRVDSERVKIGNMKWESVAEKCTS